MQFLTINLPQPGRLGCEAQRLHEALNAANPDPGRLARAEAEPGERLNLRADLAPDDTAPIVFVIAKCAAPAQRL